MGCRALLVATLMASLCLPALAGAYSGRTTNTTYRTGTLAAAHTAAYYVTKDIKSTRPRAKVFLASDMQVIKRGKTPAGKVSSSWRLVTRRLLPTGYTGLITVKVKKLSPRVWKGYTDGKNTLSRLAK